MLTRISELQLRVDIVARCSLKFSGAVLLVVKNAVTIGKQSDR
jgi:hypothetical protein